MDRPLLPLRSALVFLLAALSGVAAGGLSWLAGEGAARGVLAGFAVASLATAFFDRLITPGADEACGKAHDRG
ncbi:hypothetical protein LXH09_33045 [Streptomyces sp. CS7]|uniref:hypothetical protein n=1 Tax=Streptomyces sp. CS-7 TaxID=2906769 RepID=UPI0021B1F5D7|nr:hypothetical protein [Streptomyces sp. CS-7]MCT6781471.1 hypothetical protein [Streptomyces sp. CS-7]